MQAKKMFRGALFGYNKKDVSDYIFNMSSEADDRLRDLESKNKKLTEKAEGLAQENDQLTLDLAQKTRDFYEASQKLAELEKTSERIQSKEGEIERQLEELKETLAVKEEEISYYRQSLESLKSRCEQLESQMDGCIEDKLIIANAMIDAKKQADETLQKAKDSAGEVTARARDYIKRASYELSLLSAQIDEARSKIIGVYTGADVRVSEAVTSIESLENSLSLLLEEDVFSEESVSDEVILDGAYLGETEEYI